MNLVKQALILGIILFELTSKLSAQEFFIANQKLATPKKGNVYGVINGKGLKIANFKYDNIRFSQHHFLVSVEKNGPCDVIDTTGKTLFNNISNAYFLGNEKFVWIKKLDNLKNGKWLLFSKDGNMISKNTYDNIFFTNYINHALALKDSTYSFVDTTGKILFTNNNYQSIKETIAGFYSSSQTTATTNANSKSVHPSVLIFKDKETKHFGVKMNGKSIVAPIFNEIKKTDYNFLIVRKANKYGLIDYAGKSVLGFDYDKISEVTEIFAIVNKNGKCGVIDLKSKNLIIPLDYKGLSLVK